MSNAVGLFAKVMLDTISPVLASPTAPIATLLPIINPIAAAVPTVPITSTSGSIRAN